jgi:putative transposase
MAHTFTNLLSHVTFSTAERAPFLRDALRPPLFAYMGGIVRELGGNAILINGALDHVHLLTVLPPAVSMSEAMRVLKSNSSGWVHDTRPAGADFAWQAGYGAFSVSQSNREAVLKYIAEQEQHHRKMTFKEEFVALLSRHGIEYDERYIWE